MVICLCDHNHIRILEIIWKNLTIGKAVIFLIFLVLQCVAHGWVAVVACSPDKARRTVCCLFSDYALWAVPLYDSVKQADLKGLKDVLCF